MYIIYHVKCQKKSCLPTDSLKYFFTNIPYFHFSSISYYNSCPRLATYLYRFGREQVGRFCNLFLMLRNLRCGTNCDSKLWIRRPKSITNFKFVKIWWETLKVLRVNTLFIIFLYVNNLIKMLPLIFHLWCTLSTFKCFSTNLYKFEIGNRFWPSYS